MPAESADPATLTPHERLLELAAIFARGIHRTRGQTLQEGQNLPESGSSCLELSVASCPYGHREPESRKEDVHGG
jgi:hypothetical protein